MPIYLPIHLSTIFTLSRSSDPLPSHNQPALKGKAESFISINHSPLHYHWYHLRTSSINYILYIFEPPADENHPPSAAVLWWGRIPVFEKTTCNFLVSQGGRCIAATCWVSTYAFCLWAVTVITAWLSGPVQDTFPKWEDTVHVWNKRLLGFSCHSCYTLRRYI